MFSRALLILILGALLAAFTGCSLYEGPPAEKKKEFQKGNLGCMKDFRAKLLNYVDGKATPDDVNRLSKCSIDALRTFAELTRGESRDKFTAQEIRNFLQRYFLEDVVITDGLLNEFMRVKSAFLGGKSTDFSREDLVSAESFILAIRDILLRLQPVMPISLDRVKTENAIYVDSAGQAIIDASEILGKKITENRSTYSFEDMGRLLDELMVTFTGTKSYLSVLRGNLKAAGVLKEIVIAPNRPREVVTAGDWRLIFQEGSRWTATYLKMIRMDAQNSNLFRGQGRRDFGSIISDALDHIERVISRHCPEDQMVSTGCKATPGIPVKLLEDLIDSLDWDGSIGNIRFEKSTVRKLVDPFIRHILGGEDLSVTGRAATSLTAQHLDRFRGIVREWLDGARYVEGVYAKVLKNEAFADAAGIKTSELVSLLPQDILRAQGGATADGLVVAEGLRALFKQTYSITNGDSTIALFDGKNKTRLRSYAELNLYTWLRPFFKRVLIGYMKGPKLASRAKNYLKDGLTLEEFTDFITDYWQVLVDLKMVGPRNSPASDGERRFREAALFMQVSDGSLLISVDEGLQLVLFMMSGDPLAHLSHDRAGALCKKGEIDDYGQPKSEPVCYRKEMYDFSVENKKTADLWKPFPVLIDFYQGLAASKQAEFRTYVEIASRKVGYDEKTWFGSDDTQTTVMMFHYLEALFLKFDANRDGFIDKAEAGVAFPIFANTLAKIADMKPTDAKLKSVFLWLLSEGAPPVDDSMSGWTKFWSSVQFMTWHWVGNKNIEADRLALLKVFATLANPEAVAKLAK